MIVGPRIEFDPSHYPRIRVWDQRAGHDRYVYLHRMTAYAHGLIDDLWEEVDVHHINKDRWDNRPSNLEAVGRAYHERVEPHVGNLR